MQIEDLIKNRNFLVQKLHYNIDRAIDAARGEDERAVERARLCCHEYLTAIEVINNEILIYEN